MIRLSLLCRFHRSTLDRCECISTVSTVPHQTPNRRSQFRNTPTQSITSSIKTTEALDRASERTQICGTSVLFLSLFSCNFEDQLSMMFGYTN